MRGTPLLSQSERADVRGTLERRIDITITLLDSLNSITDLLRVREWCAGR